MAKTKKPIAPYTGPLFEVGAAIRLKRPNQHFGLPAKVLSLNKDSGEHLVRVSKDGAEFNASAKGEEMEVDRVMRK